ncbi:MAG: hypothetical protein WDW38_007982 [Sanguina aurantia]
MRCSPISKNTVPSYLAWFQQVIDSPWYTPSPFTHDFYFAMDLSDAHMVSGLRLQQDHGVPLLVLSLSPHDQHSLPFIDAQMHPDVSGCSHPIPSHPRTTLTPVVPAPVRTQLSGFLHDQRYPCNRNRTLVQDGENAKAQFLWGVAGQEGFVGFRAAPAQPSMRCMSGHCSQRVRELTSSARQPSSAGWALASAAEWAGGDWTSSSCENVSVFNHALSYRPWEAKAPVAIFRGRCHPSYRTAPLPDGPGSGPSYTYTSVRSELCLMQRQLRRSFLLPGGASPAAHLVDIGLFDSWECSAGDSLLTEMCALCRLCHDKPWLEPAAMASQYRYQVLADGPGASFDSAVCGHPSMLGAARQLCSDHDAGLRWLGTHASCRRVCRRGARGRKLASGSVTFLVQPTLLLYNHSTLPIKPWQLWWYPLLTPGRHYIPTTAAGLPAAVAGCVARPDGCRGMGEAARSVMLGSVTRSMAQHYTHLVLKHVHNMFRE